MSPTGHRVLNRGLAVVLCGLCWWGLPGLAKANPPEQWIGLGRQMHGGFGSYLALGIRIGLDARERLNAEPRELAVIYYSGATVKDRPIDHRSLGYGRWHDDCNGALYHSRQCQSAAR